MYHYIFLVDNSYSMTQHLTKILNVIAFPLQTPFDGVIVTIEIFGELVEVFNPLKLPIESFPVEANPVVVLFVYQLNVVLDDPVKLINPELFPLQTVTSSIGLTKAPGIISTESFK